MDIKLLDQAASEVAGNYKEGRDTVVKNNFASASNVNPDQEAEARRLSKITELPLQTTRAQPELVKKQATDTDLDKLAMNDNSPVTAEFFMDSNNVRVAKDDLESLMELEYQFTPKAQQTQGPVMKAYYGPEPSISSIPRSIGSAVTSGFSLAYEGLGAMISDAMGWDMAAQESIKEAQRIRGEQSLLRPNYRSGFASAVHSGLESTALVSPGIVASIATANPAPALAMAGTLTTGDAYTRYRERGASPSQAMMASLGEGSVEVATELLPMGFLVDKLGKQGMKEVLEQRLGDTVSSFVGYGAREVPGEQIATFLQDAIDTAVANPDKTWNDFMNERPQAAYQTLVATLTGTSAFAGARAGARYFTRGARREEEERVAQLTQAAMNSKLRQRDPALFKEFMDKVAENNPNLSDFYVSPNALAQSGVNLEDLEDLTPEMMNEMRIAENTGRDARIPVSEFTANLMDTNTGQALLDHLKLGPHEMSKAEQEAYMREQGAELRAEVESALEKQQNDEAFQTSKQTVQDEITKALNEAGRFTNDVNQANATLAANFYATQAQRLGMTPEEMFRKYPVKVQSTLNNGFSFADYNQTSDTNFQKWFKGSAVTDQRGQPLRVYHGTPDARPLRPEGGGVFQTSLERYSGNPEGRAYFFTNDRKTAESYADDTRAFDYQNAEPDVLETYLSLQNPLVVDNKGKKYEGAQRQEQLIAEAKAAGHDGIIVKNTIDDYNVKGRNVADVYIAFSPEQIKSVRNQGTFDPNDPNIYNQSNVSPETLKRDELGFYSQLAREVLNMNLPNWKPNKKRALDSKELAEIKDLDENPINSTADPRYERSKELIERQRQAAGLASGKEIMAKINTLPVKKEEIEWLGIEDFLMSRDKHTRQEVVDYIQNNGVYIQEVVGDQLEEENELRFDSGTVYDDPEAWEHHAEDIAEELRDDPEYQDRAVDEIMYEEREYIAQQFEDRDDIEINVDGSTSDVEVIEWVQENFADEIQQKAEEAIERDSRERAEEAYRDDPYMIYEAEGANSNYFIFGNDDIGYTIRLDDPLYGESIGDTAYSLGEAEIQAEGEARERGDLGAEDDTEVAKWADHVMPGDIENYRELKLTLPHVEGDFYNDVHFPDRNVLAFLRVDDRELPTGEDIRANVDLENLIKPDDVVSGATTTLSQAQRRIESADALVEETLDYFQENKEAVLQSTRQTEDGTPPIAPEVLEGNIDDRDLAGIYSLLSRTVAKEVESTKPHFDRAYEAVAEKSEADFLKKNISELRSVKLKEAISEFNRIKKQEESVTFTPEYKIAQYPEGADFGRGGLWYAEMTNAPAWSKYADFRTETFTSEEALNAKLDELKSQFNEVTVSRSFYTPSPAKRTFFVDEFQSDWHQQAREKGYDTPEINAEYDKLSDQIIEIEEEIAGLKDESVDLFIDLSNDMTSTDIISPMGAKSALNTMVLGRAVVGDLGKDEFIRRAELDVPENAFGELKRIAETRWDDIVTLHEKHKEFAEASAPLQNKLNDLRARRRKLESPLPNAPFKNDAWINLGVKRAIISAVEGGYDHFAWVTSEVVVDRWSDRYEKAYRNQYDLKMKSIAKKLTGKTPEFVDLGYGEQYWSVPITDELRKRVMNEGFPLFQDKDKIKRGAFSPETSTITLLRDADLSTFIHEFGHFGLEVQVDIASRPDAPDQIKNDLDALFKWMGVEGRTRSQRLSKWRSMTLDEKRDMHEQFARGMEAYIMEGKAPSAELRQLFQRFRDWLVSVYKQLKNLNVELTPEVRKVFDRLLATDAAIAEAEEIAKYEPLFKDAQIAGMSGNEFVEYQKLGAQATADAKSMLDKRNMRDMQWLSGARSAGLKKMQKKAEDKRREVRAEVTAEVKAEPVYRAEEYLRRGTIDGEKASELPVKLSIAELKATYGKDTPLYKSIVAKFGYGQYGMLGDENGIHPDQVAELFGFNSGDQLVKMLLDAEPVKEKIDGITDQRMLERYGDLTDPESIEQAVMESLRNDTRAKFVAAEVAALTKATGGRKFLNDAARMFSEEMIARERIRNIRPYQYEVAEAKAAREAQKAMARTDIDVAAGHKRNQLINLYAAKNARKALDDVEKGLKYFKKFERTRKKGKVNIDAEYLDQIDALLARFNLKKITGKAADRRVSLRDWVAKQEEQGLQPDVPAALLDDVSKRSYQEMTVQEFRGLRDTVRQIEHMGRMKNKLLTAKKQRNFDAAKAEILNSLNEHAPKKKIDLRTRANAGGTVKEMGVNFLSMHRKMASLLQEMDGFVDAGPMWEYIVRGMNDAGDRETTLREESTVKLSKITQLILNDDRLGGKGEFFPSIGQSLNKEERLAIALNLGNEGNTQRLLDGEGWTTQQLQPVIDTLTKADWDFVQEVWDYFESFRPAIAAKERRIYGREPEWVEPKPIETKFGSYRGGYYPIKYDAKRSGASQQFQEAEAAKQMLQNAFTASTTRRSFTKNRAEEVVGRPLEYSFRGIYQGTEEIVHDLTHHEWLIDVNKFLRDSDIDKAVRNLYGAEAADLIKRAVRDIAVGNQPAQNVWEQGLNHVRMGATVAGLGWNFATSLLQPLGLTNSMARIGPGWVGRGLTAWFKSPTDTVEEIYSKSEFMRLRAKTMQREINEIQNRLQEPGFIQDKFGKVVGQQNAQKTKEFMEWSMFLTIQKMQLIADVPTWLGQYEKSISEGKSDETAARLADQAVIDAQGGGQIKDLSEIQRGGPMQKLWTNFYSYFNVVYNLNADIKNRTDWKDPYQVAVAARDYALVMIAPAVLGKMMKDAITGGDDEEWNSKDYAKALASEQVSYLFGTMVGLRETAAVAQRIAGVSQYNGSYGGPAGLRILTELDKLGTQVSQGKLDRALRKSAINTAGILFHLPAAQINRSLDGLMAVAEGDAGPIAIIGGVNR